MGDLTDRLNAIKALALRDLDNTSDEQIRAEFIEDKQDPSEVAHKVAASLARVAERTAASQHAMTAIDAKRSELYALEVKHAELVDQFEAMRQQRDALQRRVAALEADAGRYRWLRSQPLDDPEIWIAVDSAKIPGRWALGGDDPDGCDAAIDAAMVAVKTCHYPECVDSGPDGKCTAWLIGDCEGPKSD